MGQWEVIVSIRECLRQLQETAELVGAGLNSLGFSLGSIEAQGRCCDLEPQEPIPSVTLGEGLKEGRLLHPEGAERELVSADESSAGVGRKRGDCFEKCLRTEINLVLGTEALKRTKKGHKKHNGRT